MSKHPKPGSGKPPFGANQGSQQSQPCKWDGNVRVTSEVPVQLPKDLLTNYETSQTDISTHNRKILLVNWLTFGAIVIYAALTAWQAYESRRSARDAETAIQQAKSQFVLDRRPFVWLTATGTGTPQYYFPKKILKGDTSPHGQIYWNYHYTDYGKTFAKGMQILSQEIQVGKASPFVSSYQFHLQESQGTPLPPGKDDFDTVVSNPGIKGEEFNKLMGEDRAISIRVKIRYFDIDGNSYETGICLTHLAANATQYCTQDNYMKYPSPHPSQSTLSDDAQRRQIRQQNGESHCSVTASSITPR